jgi:hypothetical protein
MTLEHLRLSDLSDREILLVVADTADDEGWSTADDVGERLGMPEESRRRMAAMRLSWMARYGAVQSDPDRPGGMSRWRLTAIGQAIAQGRLRRAHERAVDDADDAQLLLLSRIVAERARGSGSSAAAKLIEREWRHRWLRVNGRR